MNEIEIKTIKRINNNKYLSYGNCKIDLKKFYNLLAPQMVRYGGKTPRGLNVSSETPLL